jgi:hypothetical protein
MLNNMIASFSASNQVGELMKKRWKGTSRRENIELPENQKSEHRKQKNRVLEFIKKRGLIASFSLVNQFFINGMLYLI